MTDCYKTMRLDDLVEDPHNARLHDMPNLTAIRASLLRFGQVEPLVVQSGTNQVVGGNGRLRVMRALGWETAEVREVDLDDKEAIALGLALNRTAELATWDETMLRAHLKTLSDADFDIGGFSLDEKELKNLNFGVEEKPEVTGKTDPNEVPEAPKDPITKPGDLWILGNHRLLCGDSTNIQHVERLMDGQKADITFTSPPYNASKNGHLNGRVKGFECKYENSQDAMSDDEYLALIYDATISAVGVSDYAFVNLQLLAHNKVVLTDYQYKLRHLLKDVLIWNKHIAPPNIVKGAFNTKFEYIYVFSQDAKTRGFPCQWQGKHPNVVETENNSANQYAEDHRAGFPVAFPQWFIDRLDFVKSIYEPFCGTGTTLIAAEQNRLTCYGMELDPSYCDVIVKRWEDFTGQKAVRA